MFLFINNLSGNKVFSSLFKSRNDKNLVWIDSPKQNNQSENILKGIDRLLKGNRKSWKAIKGIVVVNGPGSFAGIRIALSVANTLAWLLRIPVVGVNLRPSEDNKILMNRGLAKLLKFREKRIVQPFYGQEPKITS